MKVWECPNCGSDAMFKRVAHLGAFQCKKCGGAPNDRGLLGSRPLAKNKRESKVLMPGMQLALLCQLRGEDGKRLHRARPASTQTTTSESTEEHMTGDCIKVQVVNRQGGNSTRSPYRDRSPNSGDSRKRRARTQRRGQGQTRNPERDRCRAYAGE
jgi:hypothetical protein